MSSRYTKKRKHDLDSDTSGGGGGSSRGNDEASPKKSSRRQNRESSESPPYKGGAKEDSLSIEETNKLRISLGLAPLEVDEGPKVKETENGEGNVVVEDGMEFVHKAAESLTKKKETQKIKEKIDVQAQKRKLQTRLLKAKTLAASDSEDEGVESWIEKNRRLEEERNKAIQRAKEFDAFDDELVQNVPKKAVKKPRPKKTSEDALAGMTVGHSKSAFMTGEETILVLGDKDVLDDDGEEVLVNPTLMYNEQLKKNKDMRNKKSDYNPYDDEEVDEFGMVKKKNLLAKYDEEIDGPNPKETFKLDKTGGFDLTREEEEERVKRGLFMANRQLQSLETSKYTVACEFYTNEEMVSFRKPKKKKDGSKSRKRKGNKEDISSTLQPEEETEAEKKAREQKLRARRAENGNDEVKMEKAEVDGHEEGEIVEPIHPEVPKQRFRDTMGGSVDTVKMRNLLDKLKKEQAHDDDDEEDFEERNDLAGVVIDDDVEDELSNALEKARKLKMMKQVQKEDEDSASRTRKKFESLRNVKLEVDKEMEIEEETSGRKRIIFDATAEFYKTIGDLPTYGLAGNRDDHVDYSEVLAEQAKEKDEKMKSEVEDEKVEISLKKKEKKDKRERYSTRREKDKKKEYKREITPEDEKMDIDEEEKEKEYVNVLGKEKDVTKGVAGMLKLASEKGYLEDPNAKKNKGGTLKHLESQNFAKVEFTKYDIEDKYLKKMERLGTTGSGPRRTFQDKKDYNPQVEITYTDPQGKEMDPKAAFRSLSHKFHGKQPGKKQVEKRMRQQDKKERLKKMNSSDTPLGTLDKQRKKLEQLQTPYLILSGSNRETGVSLQKE